MPTNTRTSTAILVLTPTLLHTLRKRAVHQSLCQDSHWEMVLHCVFTVAGLERPSGQHLLDSGAPHHVFVLCSPKRQSVLKLNVSEILVFSLHFVSESLPSHQIMTKAGRCRPWVSASYSPCSGLASGPVRTMPAKRHGLAYLNFVSEKAIIAKPP